MRRNRGFALAATMMVLALISVLGAMAIQSATLEAQISAHDRDARAAGICWRGRAGAGR